jgi:hypothetical protein
MMTLTIARRMLSADILKLRRNRAIMVIAALLSVGVVVVFFGYDAIQHAVNPSQNGPAGGVVGFGRAVRVLGVFFGTLVAALIGSEAGTADIASGVFRDLVATGRSRLALFWVRWPAAFLVTFACTGAALIVATVLSFVFAGNASNGVDVLGSNLTPNASLILQSALWVAMCNAVITAFAVGVGSLTGSRGATLTVVIGWQAVASQLILHTQSLGSARDWLTISAFGQLMPVEGDLAGISMATGLAVLVLLAWVIVPTAVGSWRTATQDA